MKFVSFLMILLALALAACSSSESDGTATKLARQKKVQVTTRLVQKEKAPVFRSFPGTVASADTAFLRPKVVGYIDTFLAEPGDTFKKGALLVRIKSKELVDKKNFAQSAVKEAKNGEKQAALGLKMAGSGLKQAEARYILAEKMYRRFNNLLKTESVSRQEFDEVEAKYKAALEAQKIAQENVKLAAEKFSQISIKKQQAIAMLDEVKTYLGYTSLKAPFDGIVLRKMMDIGNLAASSEGILKIGSLDNIVYAHVNGSAMRAMKTRDEVTIDVPSADVSFKANILEINPNIDPATRTFRVKLSGDAHLIPGMYCNVSFDRGSEEMVIVPNSAVLRRGQLSIVFVAKDKRAEMRIVKTGRIFKNSMEILSGLYPGEKIVLNKVEQLKSGDSLEE